MTVTGSREALKGCPFCGGIDVSDRYVRDGRQMFCIGCGASVAATYHGPCGDTLERATEAWNTRASPDPAGVTLTLEEIARVLAQHTGTHVEVKYLHPLGHPTVESHEAEIDTEHLNSYCNGDLRDARPACNTLHADPRNDRSRAHNGSLRV